ncbi:MAG: AtpZ/AtpI family protein [Tyzzerella sp.]|nr:AtpZ/AtpI family protein [Tyzzerella sp.]
MKHNKIIFNTLALISQLGISIIVPILLCTFAGVFLEERYSISITVPLIILGVLAGGRNAYYLLRQANKDSGDKEDEER